jgi:hypothetical protein
MRSVQVRAIPGRNAPLTLPEYAIFCQNMLPGAMRCHPEHTVSMYSVSLRLENGRFPRHDATFLIIPPWRNFSALCGEVRRVVKKLKRVFSQRL